MNTRKIRTLLLVGLLLNLFLYPSAWANSKEDRNIKKVRAAVEKLGAGVESRIKVKLKDKSKLSGHVGEISDEYFTVVDQKLGSETRVPYSSVKQVQGNNLSTGVAIAVAIGFIVLLAIVWVIVADR